MKKQGLQVNSAAAVVVGLLVAPVLLVTWVSKTPSPPVDFPRVSLTLVFVVGLLSVISVAALFYVTRISTRRQSDKFLIAVGATQMGLLYLGWRDRSLSGYEIAVTSLLIPIPLAFLIVFRPGAVVFRRASEYLVWILSAIVGLSLAVSMGERLFCVDSTRPESLGAICSPFGYLTEALSLDSLNYAVLGCFVLAVGALPTNARHMLLCVGLGVGLLALSESRSSLLAGLCILMLWAVLALKRDKRLVPPTSVAVSTGVLFIVGLLSANVLTVETQSSDTGLSPRSEPGLVETSLNGRLAIWQTHWSLVRETPFSMLGRTSADITQEIEVFAESRDLVLPPSFNSSHNFFLDTWLRYGVIGIVLASVLAILSCLVIWTAYRQQRFAIGLLFGTGLVVLMMFDTLISWTEVGAGLFMLNLTLGWCVAEGGSSDNSNKPALNRADGATGDK